MKCLSYLLLVAVLAGSTACGGNNQSKNSKPDVKAAEEPVMDPTSIQFTTTEHDFGKVKEGEKVTFNYEFTNTGKADLLIQKAQASCGCTIPKYSKEPVRPGKKGYVEVVFNTKGHPGKQRKSVRVTANTEPVSTVLVFTCEVEPAEKKNN